MIITIAIIMAIMTTNEPNVIIRGDNAWQYLKYRGA
jgi:hypothetical protein